MSKFYGTVQGNRGEATRGGSKNSGIKATAQSWEGSVSVLLFNENEEIRCNIIAGKGSTSDPSGVIVYTGTLADLLKNGWS